MVTLFLKPLTDGALIKVYIQPKSSHDGLAGYHGDALKIKLKAPPVEGAANTACIRFLASMLRLPQTNLSIKSGHRSRSKLVVIKGISVKQVRETLANQSALTA